MTLREKVEMKVAWLMPKRVAYWCAIRLGAFATVGKYGNESPSGLKFMDALERWREA